RLQPLAARVSRLSMRQASATGSRLGSEGSLMLGWLATRLGWKSTSLGGRLRLLRPDDGVVNAQLSAEPRGDLPAGTLLALRIEAGSGDLAVRGEIVREAAAADAGVATWCLEVTSHGETNRIEQRVRLRDGEPARLLERTLHRPPHDAALVEAV